MNHDISQPVPQGSNGAQDAENSRIAAIANELERLCTIHEAQSGDSQQNVSRFEKTTQDGCFRNSQYEVWDVLPRNVLVDDEGDIFVVDAEIKHITSSIT